MAVVGGIHRLPEDFQPFRFRVVDQSGVGRGSLARIENNADPSEGSGETRREVEIHLVVRNRIDRESKPRRQARLVVPGKNRAVFLQKGVVGHGQLIEGELAGLALAAFRTVGIHTGELRGSCLIRAAKLCGLHIIRPRREGGIEFFPDVPSRLVAKVHRCPGAEPRSPIIENDETKSVRNRRPVESQRHAARWDIEGQIRARSEKRTAADRPHVCRVEQEVAIVACAGVIRDRAHLRGRECGAIPIKEQQSHCPSCLSLAPAAKCQPNADRETQNEKPRDRDSSQARLDFLKVFRKQRARLGFFGSSPR